MTALCGVDVMRLCAMNPKALLSSLNAHPRDSFIEFDESSHSYTVEMSGVKTLAPTSATKFAERYFTPFNAAEVVARNYKKWKADEASVYHASIHSALSAGADDGDAQLAIIEGWERKSREASSVGTAVHEQCELVCNGAIGDMSSVEISQLIDWMNNWQTAKRWEPFRTEWRLYYDVDGQLVMAGTPDLVLKSAETGEFALVDFKISASLLGPSTGRFSRQAQPPMQCFEDSKYGRYGAQLNILSHMLNTRYGVDVGPRMYLLQLHKDLEKWHCVQVSQKRDEVETLFSVETQRMLSR